MIVFLMLDFCTPKVLGIKILDFKNPDARIPRIPGTPASGFLLFLFLMLTTSRNRRFHASEFVFLRFPMLTCRNGAPHFLRVLILILLSNLLNLCLFL